MSDWPTSDIKVLVTHLPRVPIGEIQSKKEDEVLDSHSENDPDPLTSKDADFLHPSAFWGYRQHLQELSILYRMHQTPSYCDR